MKKRPNVIIFNPDEMRLDALHHMGLNAAALTPNLDAFASSDAVSFSNAFCQNPVCVPSRCSMFTGLYPHVNGHRTMSYLLREGEASLFSELKESGYYVWMNSRNDLISGNREGLFESHATEVFYGGNVPPSPGRKKKREYSAKKYFSSQFGGELEVDGNGLNYSPDDEDVDALCERIMNRKSDKPFFGFVGLMYPHCPYQVEEPYYSATDRSELPERIRWEDCSGKSRMIETIRNNIGLSDMTEDDWRELRAVYAGMCMKVDAEFGRVIDALKKSGEYDDTLIIFVSDHGDFAGDYGLPEKAQNTFEDCLVRVPFLVKPPKSAGAADAGISSSIVELVDLYATVHDYCGTEPVHTHFGRSLRPVLENRETVIRDFAICEGGRLPSESHCNEFLQSAGPGVPTSSSSPYYPRHLAQTDDRAHAKALMIRTLSEKYVSRISGEDEYYDLVNDPQEKHNLILDNEVREKVIRLQQMALRHLLATSDIVPFDRDNRFTQRMVWEKVKSMVPEGQEEKIRDMIRHGANRFMLVEYLKRGEKQ